MVEAAQIPLEKTFVKLVEQRLNEGNGHQFEVLNAGVASSVSSSLFDQTSEHAFSDVAPAIS